MNDDQRQSWVQSAAGVIIVNGVIAAVVGSIVTWAISNAASLPWSQVFLVFAVVAVVVLLVASLLGTRLKRLVWGNFARLLRMLASLRLTTSARIAATLKTEYDRGYRDGEVWGEPKFQIVPAGPPDPPLPLPRWTVQRSGDDGTFVLMNAVPRSVAKEVRLEGDSDFDVTDAGHWADLSGEAQGIFHGFANYQGRTEGVTFTISWYDEASNQHRGHKTIGGWEEGNWGESPF